ncbi:MAG: hypothetical protein SGPRY_008659, partial [Prymnesium sp.]
PLPTKAGSTRSSSTSASLARAQSLRRLYIPTCLPGQSLTCINAARVYEEARVCDECYRVYAKKSAGWAKQPKTVFNVASVPALGFMGREFGVLPEGATE